MKFALKLILALSLAISALAQTTSKTLVLIGDYSINGTTYPLGCTLGQVANTMFSDPNGFSVKETYKEASYGKYLLTGDTFGPYHVVADDLAFNGQLECGQYVTIANRMLAQATAQGIDKKKYNRFVYVLPLSAGCVNGAGVLGNTDISSNTSWIFACDAGMTYEHEIGHTLFMNADHTIDDADPMNSQNNTVRFFNAAGTLALNWMDPAGLVNLTHDGAYNIAPLEYTRSQTATPQIYRLTTGVATYALSYRQQIGVDRDLNPTSLADLRINATDANRNLINTISPGHSLVLDGITIQNSGSSPSNLSFTVTGLAPAPPPPTCQPSATTLCLQNGRFSVTGTFVNNGTTGTAQAIQSTVDSGYFWFFNSNNPELGVKIVDGRPVNGSFWIYWGGLTNLEYTLTVTDVTTNTTEVYHNVAGSTCGGSDTSFGTPGAVTTGTQPTVTSGIGSPSTCTPSASTLCLQPGGDIIKVEVNWKNGTQTGVGTGGFLPNTAQGGYFTFFNAVDTDLMVKALDGRAINGRYWIFTGSLTNVEYWVTFTDTTSGRWVSLHNPAGNDCGAAITGLLY